jgi:hypothetical protein
MLHFRRNGLRKNVAGGLRQKMMGGNRKKKKNCSKMSGRKRDARPAGYARFISWISPS